ncbi:MAG: hypothetical protein ACO25L_01945 [Candidatus Nanopelagicales bacterium]
MTQEKWIYSFSLDKEILIDKSEASKDETGADIVITKKVKEKKPFSFKIKKPNRRLIEDADIFYAAKVGEFLKAGLLSKNLILKRLENDGGDLGEESKKEFSEIIARFYEIKTEMDELQKVIAEKNTQEDKDKFSDLTNESEDLRFKLAELEQRRNAIFEQSAESKALNKQVFWYILNTTYWNKGDEKAEFIPFFEGKTFEEKSDSYDAKEEQEGDSEFFASLTSRLAFAISYWFNSSNKATPEDIDKMLNEMLK